MSAWLLTITVYPYICIAIFLMGVIWRYDQEFILDHSQSNKKYIFYYSLRIMFIVLMFIFIIFRMFLHPQSFSCPIIAIFTFNFHYDFVVELSFILKLFVIKTSSLLMLFAFTPVPNIFWKIRNL